MKITLEQTELAEPEIVIRGNISSPQVQNVVELLNGKKSLQKMFLFKAEKEYYRIQTTHKRRKSNCPCSSGMLVFNGGSTGMRQRAGNIIQSAGA